MPFGGDRFNYDYSRNCMPKHFISEKEGKTNVLQMQSWIIYLLTRNKLTSVRHTLLLKKYLLIREPKWQIWKHCHCPVWFNRWVQTNQTKIQTYSFVGETKHQGKKQIIWKKNPYLKDKKQQTLICRNTSKLSKNLKKEQLV